MIAFIAFIALIALIAFISFMSFIGAFIAFIASIASIYWRARQYYYIGAPRYIDARVYIGAHTSIILYRGAPIYHYIDVPRLLI